MDLTRAALLDHLAESINGLGRNEPTLVAIDGRSAAGKTTLADDLAERLCQQGQSVVRRSMRRSCSTLHTRMNNPALVVPDAMQALQALWSLGRSR